MSSENTDPISSGSRVDALKAMRDILAAELRTAEGSAVAAISRELRVVLAELEAFGVRAEVTPLDDLASRVGDQLAAQRARRQSGAEAS